MDGRGFRSPVALPVLVATGGLDRGSVGQRIVRACRARLFEGGVFEGMQ